MSVHILQAILIGALLLQLEEVRKHLRSDRLLQSQYTFVQRETERQLNRDGSQKQSEITVAEIYPSLEEHLTYRRVVSKDGQPLAASEIEKHDREHDRKVAEYTHKLEQEGQDGKQTRLAKEAAEKQKEDAIIQEVFRMYSIDMLGRETRGGQETIVLAFRARPEYKPQSRETKLLSKVAGKAWFDEKSYQLVRVESELLDNFSLGFGILARFNKGAKAVFERRLVNDEVWLPAYASFSGTGRLMLLKALRLEVVNEFSDYRKYTVETVVGAGSPPQP
jgi:hypothetical protein